MSTPSQLSFLPDDYLERKAQRRTNLICAVLFIVVMTAITGAFTVTERSLSEEERVNAVVNREYTDAAKLIKQWQEMQTKERKMAQQAELSASLVEKVQRSRLLAEITNALPSGVSLLDLNLESRKRGPRAPAATAVKPATFEQKSAKGKKAPAEPPPLEPKVLDVHMKITGVAGDDMQVAQYITRLNQSKRLRDVNLIISEEHKRDNRIVRRFQIEMMIDPNAEWPANDKPTLVRMDRN
jgi:Tfp pilus assembly protein PilN